MQKGLTANSSPATAAARSRAGPAHQQHEHNRGSPGEQRVEGTHLVDPADHPRLVTPEMLPASLQVEESRRVQEEQLPVKPGEPARGNAVTEVGVDHLVAEQVKRAVGESQPDEQADAT